MRISQLWQSVRQLAGSEREAIYEPSRVSEIRESVADIGLAKSGLGFLPSFSFKRGLEATFEWYREKHNGI
ncbi:hypothetical protein ACFL0M_11955 [Thermodesulfobacteriota bacterium]